MKGAGTRIKNRTSTSSSLHCRAKERKPNATRKRRAWWKRWENSICPGVIHCRVCVCLSSVALPPDCLCQLRTWGGFGVCMHVCVFCYVCFLCVSLGSSYSRQVKNDHPVTCCILHFCCLYLCIFSCFPFALILCTEGEPTSNSHFCVCWYISWFL